MHKVANRSLLLTLLSLSLALVLTQAGLKGYATLAAKAKEQNAITDSVVRWKHSYLALAGTQERWGKTYRAASTIPDMLSLVALMDLPAYGLRASTDTLVLKTAEQLKANNIELGLTKLCLGTAAEHFVVEAGSYDALLRGLDKLAHRADVVVDNVSIVGEKEVPQAKLGELCLLFRSE
ncbi:hypothetical protein [Rugamonas aquatica]|uniref:Uncharacterized protein n=1 Tax=Rugamonas aquatica TaxID=2743357 RepID=A0A6A7N7C7_9BURK|nr:hypothetical protein [Rugamonas aquatica]MQA40762.1 hypothetical protein [Rugamonas aquatica]